MSKRTPAQRAPRQRPNHPRATNPSSHVARVPSQEASTNKKSKTVKEAILEQWSSKEQRKLFEATQGAVVLDEDKWNDVAVAVGSRSARQCKTQYYKLKRANRLEPISEGTLIRPLIFGGFTNKAFDKCVAEHLDNKITTVGQLAALDLDISKEANKLYLQKLTGYKFMSLALKMAAPWKEKAAEAIEFWK